MKRVKAGEDFAKVAKAVSKDPGSEGGDLGWFTKDRMIPEFADAAFKLQVGQVSDPVKTQFGWHIIKLEGRRQTSFPPFEAGQGAGGPLCRAKGAGRSDRRTAQDREDRALRCGAGRSQGCRRAGCTDTGCCAREEIRPFHDRHNGHAKARRSSGGLLF